MKNLFNIHQDSEFAKSLVKLLGAILANDIAKVYLTCTYDAFADTLYVAWNLAERARLELTIERHRLDLFGDCYNITGSVGALDSSFEVLTQPSPPLRVRAIHLGTQFDEYYEQLKAHASDQHANREKSLVTLLEAFALVASQSG